MSSGSKTCWRVRKRNGEILFFERQYRDGRAECMVEVKNLCKKYGDFVALDDLNFDVADGEVFGFVGPNGAGKTTTMRIMAGLISLIEGV